MRRVAFLSLIAAAVLTVAAPQMSSAAAPPGGQIPVAPQFSEGEKADLKRISDYLNTLKSVQGSFLQVAGDGRSVRGTFYLRKPGRMRFEYEKPNPNLIVADGTTVAVQNADLRTTDRYPLLNSPLRLLLSENMDLTNDPRVAAVKREQGAITMTARETSGPAMGRITLTFADAGGSNLELRQWEVVDAQGSRTTIVLNEMREVADLPARLFVIQDLSPFQKSGR